MVAIWLWQPSGCHIWECVMGFPDRIERSINVAHPPAKVWHAITTADGLGTWFGQKATVDLRVGGIDPAHRGRVRLRATARRPSLRRVRRQRRGVAERAG